MREDTRVLALLPPRDTAHGAGGSLPASETQCRWQLRAPHARPYLCLATSGEGTPPNVPRDLDANATHFVAARHFPLLSNPPCVFPTLASGGYRTCYCQLGGLRRRKCLLSRSRRPETQSQGVGSAALSPEEAPSCLSPSGGSGRPQRPSAHRRVTPGSASLHTRSPRVSVSMSKPPSSYRTAAPG